MDLGRPILPLSALDPEPTAELDYASLLLDDVNIDIDIDLDIDYGYLAEDSSTSGSSHTLPGHPLAPSRTTAERTSALHGSAALTRWSPGGNSSTSPRKAKLERRGHTKSRRGCFNCKRRRIKCQEKKPACDHCIKSGLTCEYPAVPQVVHQPQNRVPLFNMQDMRFFQHFLLKCYPSQPLGNEAIWLHEIPCLSQEHEYLMHAILGLAAADLMSQEPELITAAMAHRLKAIRAVKKALADISSSSSTRSTSSYASASSSSPSSSSSTKPSSKCKPPIIISNDTNNSFYKQGNALMATCFALTFQSVSLEDGMAEFMTFCRGIIIVAIQMFMKGSGFVFHDFMGDDGTKQVQPFLEALPLISEEWSGSAIEAVKRLEPLCRGEVERAYYELILSMAENLRVSCFDAYRSLTKHYAWWIQLPHDKFQQVIDPSSQVFTLLATHWIALKQIMATITSQEAKVSNKNNKKEQEDEGVGRWMRWLNRRVEPWEFAARYNSWPVWVQARLDEDPGYFGRGK